MLAMHRLIEIQLLDFWLDYEICDAAEDRKLAFRTEATNAGIATTKS